MLENLDDTYIEKVFSDIKKELTPFYKNTRIIEQSMYDDDTTNYDLFIQNHSDKLNYLISRKGEILSDLN